VTVPLNEVVDKGNDEYDVGNYLVTFRPRGLGQINGRSAPVIDDLLYHGD
jgi:hypothetical protein